MVSVGQVTVAAMSSAGPPWGGAGLGASVELVSDVEGDSEPLADAGDATIAWMAALVPLAVPLARTSSA